MPLYIDEKSGHTVSTHSMLKTFRRCPKQAQYKYVERLKPRSTSKPLKRGTWMHSLLEELYRPEGGDWEAKHQELSAEFSLLFDEEKEQLGDLPREIKQLMQSYLWHYGLSDPWIVHEVELVLECEFPDGTVYRGRIDMLVEDSFGLWIVDHKTHKTLPSFDFRLRDAASALYIWAAWQNKIPVQGFIWNYIKTKAPSTPKLVYVGTPRERFSTRSIETDYPTYYRAMRRAPKSAITDTERATLLQLKAQRYEHGKPQTSPFFQRHILEKDPGLIKRVVQEAYHTSRRMNDYPWERVDHVERVPDRSCTFSCSYTDLCSTELFAGRGSPGAANIRRQRYDTGDPMYYYNDDKEEGRDGDN